MGNDNENLNKPDAVEVAQVVAPIKGEVKPKNAEKPRVSAQPEEVKKASFDIYPNCTENCSIAGKWYSLVKDKKMTVSKNVFDILKQAGKLKISY